MRNRRGAATLLTTAIATTTASLALAAATSSPAVAAPSDQPLPIEEANPGLSAAVVASLPPSIQQSHMLIDDSYEPGMPIIGTDGKPIPGQPPAQMQAAAAGRCGGGFVALAGTWTPAIKGELWPHGWDLQQDDL